MVLRADYGDLKNYLSKDNMLPHWGAGGSFSFDIDEYIRWRAHKEGVTHLITNITPRRYDPAQASASSAEGDDEAMKQMYVQMTSAEVKNNDPAPAKLSSVWKKGSGKGFFANTKWKEKLLCVGLGGVAMYYDSTAISEDNKPSKIISLLGATVEETTHEDNAKGKYGFRIITASRNFDFGCATAADRDDWIKKITAEVKVAQAMRMGGNGLSDGASDANSDNNSSVEKISAAGSTSTNTSTTASSKSASEKSVNVETLAESIDDIKLSVP
jgi:PH domain